MKFAGERVIEAAAGLAIVHSVTIPTCERSSVPGPTKSGAMLPAFSLWAVLAIGVWTALLAVGLSLALVAGQNKYLGKPLFASGRVPLWLVIVGAAVAGFVSGTIGQALFFAFLSLGVAKLGHLLGWMLLGALLGAGVSFFVPNLDAKKAALAGLAGGLLGALAFLTGMWLLYRPMCLADPSPARRFPDL